MVLMNISLNFLSKLRITMLLRAHLELAILLFDLLGGGRCHGYFILLY